jgi:hypothetical protein
MNHGPEHSQKQRAVSFAGNEYVRAVIVLCRMKGYRDLLLRRT